MNGLPIHPLVVHGVVVLLPLAILGTIAIAVRPAWRAKYGHLVLAAAVVSAALTPVATSSGEALEKHVGDPGKHAELGDQLIWFVLPMVILVAALVWMTRQADKADATEGANAPTSRAVHIIAALSVLAALAAGVQVYRVGDSGARAAWGDQVSSTS